MVGQPLDVLGQPVRIAAFDGADDAGVQGLAPVLEQGAVGDFMGERMLEGVLGIREEARLVQKLGRLQMRRAPAAPHPPSPPPSRGAARRARPCR